MNPKTAKAKGTATETAWCRWANDHGAPLVERRRLKGSADEGDVTGLPGVVIEIKSGARLDIAGWLDELADEMDNARCDMGAVVVRPKGKPRVDDWFVVMPMRAWWDLLRDGGYR